MAKVEENLIEAASITVMNWSHFEELHSRSVTLLKEAQEFLESSKKLLAQREIDVVKAALRLRREEKKFQAEFSKHLAEAGL